LTSGFGIRRGGFGIRWWSIEDVHPFLKSEYESIIVNHLALNGRCVFSYLVVPSLFVFFPMQLDLLPQPHGHLDCAHVLEHDQRYVSQECHVGNDREVSELIEVLDGERWHEVDQRHIEVEQQNQSRDFFGGVVNGSDERLEVTMEQQACHQDDEDEHRQHVRSERGERDRESEDAFPR